MLSIGTNTGAIMAQAAASSVTRDMETAMHRLSTGKRINAAADDAAGVAISSRLDSTVRGLNQSIRNALDAQALIDTAEGGMQETEALLQRIRELAVQSANGTNSASDRLALDNEVKSLLTEIDRISQTTTWAGQKLLDGSFTNKNIQVGGGTMAADQLVTSISGVSAANLEVGANSAPKRVGDEFQVNTYSTGDQGTAALSGPGTPDPVIAASPNGNYLITWSSDGQDGSGEGVFAQLFSSNDMKIGNEIAINSSTASEQTYPDAAFFSDGSFIVTWQTSDSNNSGIAAQLFTSTGAKIGSEFIVNTTTAGAQRVPSLAILSDDTALITFSGYQHGGNSAYDIFGQKISKSGSFVGSEFQVNIDSSGNESTSDIVQLANGNLLVAYHDSSGAHTANAQILSSTGTRIGGEISIDGSGGHGIDVAALSEGGFVAAWQNWNSSSNAYDVFVQTFDNSGSSRTAKTYLATLGSHTFPSVAADDFGGFAVSWTASANDGTGENVYAQTFGSDGVATSPSFMLNSYSSNSQSASDVEFTVDASLIATWISESQDGDGKGVFAQRFSNNSLLSQADNALRTLNTQRASLGALSNRLDHIVANNTNAATNVAKSLGRIQDADFAAESTSLAKNQILQQASTAMLAQANASKQNILELLQG